MGQLTLQHRERPTRLVNEFLVVVKHKVYISLDGIYQHKRLATKLLRIGRQFFFRDMKIGFLDIAYHGTLESNFLERLDEFLIDQSIYRP